MPNPSSPCQRIYFWAKAPKSDQKWFNKQSLRGKIKDMTQQHIEYNTGVTKFILKMLNEAIVSTNGDLSIDDKPGSIGIQHILNTIYRSTSKEYAITCSGQFVLLDAKDNDFFDDYPKYNLEATFEEQSIDVKIFLANIIIENHYV